MWGKLSRVHVVLFGCLLTAASCLLSMPAVGRPSNQSAFDFPARLGSWQLLERAELEEGELAMLRAHDHWQRIYECPQTNQRIIATLVSGPSGPLVCHQPEVCYARSEFCSHSEIRTWSTPTGADRFRIQTLEPRDVERPAMTICYAWHDGSNWKAPKMPRLQLAGRSSLQRLQVSMRHAPGSTTDAQSVMEEFLLAAVEATQQLQTGIAERPTPSQSSR